MDLTGPPDLKPGRYRDTKQRILGLAVSIFIKFKLIIYFFSHGGVGLSLNPFK